MSVVAQGANQGSHALHGLAKGTDVSDLRADVHADAGGLQVAGGGALAIEFGGIAHGHSELVLVQPVEM